MIDFIKTPLQRETNAVGDWKYSKKISYLFDGKIEERFFLGMDEAEIEREIKRFIDDCEIAEQEWREQRSSQSTFDVGIGQTK